MGGWIGVVGEVVESDGVDLGDAGVGVVGDVGVMGLGVSDTSVMTSDPNVTPIVFN